MNHLPADDSHEISSLVFIIYKKKAVKYWEILVEYMSVVYFLANVNCIVPGRLPLSRAVKAGNETLLPCHHAKSK